MALYVGEKKWKLMLNGVAYNMHIPTSIPITNGIRLLSSDGFTIKDTKGIYLTAFEYIQSLSSDGSILTDNENNYLTIKKG